MRLKCLPPSVVLLAALTLTACAIQEPHAHVDQHSLGDSQVAKAVLPALYMGSERGARRAVIDLLDRSKAWQEADPRSALSKLGFVCSAPPATACAFDGSVEMRLEGVSSATAAANHSRTTVHVGVDAGQPGVAEVAIRQQALP